MSTTLRVAGFLAALGVVFGGAIAVGNAVGPVSEPPAAHDAAHGGDEEAGHDPATHQVAGDPADNKIPGGLMVSENGFTFRLADDTVDPGTDVPVEFTIQDADGAPVTEYDVEHEKRLHLIAVRRDGAGFQHVHPELDADTGTWTTRLDLTPGPWRLFADFTATGSDGLTLGADLAVPGGYRPEDRTAEVRTARADGYVVTLAGDLTPGDDAQLELSIERNGRPVADLEPYLGAYGHLVALRDGDLAYLHVHPDGTPGDGRTQPGPDVTFYAAVPSTGTYHLFLDFKHRGVVRTAAFAVAAAGPGDTTVAANDDKDEETEGGHGGDHNH